MSKRAALIEDDEFKRLCPPHRKDISSVFSTEYLSSNIPTIETWQKRILLDYDIYHFCLANNLRFRIEEISLNSRAEAVYYIAKHYYTLDGIGTAYRRYCIGKSYKAVSEITRFQTYHTTESLFPELTSTADLLQNRNRSRSSELCSKIFDVSSGCAAEYGAWAQAVDTIFQKDADSAGKILSGEASFALEKTISLANHTPDEIRYAVEHVREIRKITTRKNRRNQKLEFEIPDPVDKTSAKREELRNYRPAYLTRHARKKDDICMGLSNMPAIKQMPMYDPDSEVNSLSLTIPTWISSMDRTMSLADFTKVTPEGIQKLDQKLSDLQDAVSSIKNILREIKHE